MKIRRREWESDCHGEWATNDTVKIITDITWQFEQKIALTLSAATPNEIKLIVTHPGNIDGTLSAGV